MGRAQPARKTKKSEKEAAKKKGPQKPLSPYIIFANKRRPSLYQEKPHLKSEVPAASKLLGEEWRNMTEEEKEPYVSESKAQKQNYLAEKERLENAGDEDVQPAATETEDSEMVIGSEKEPEVDGNATSDVATTGTDTAAPIGTDTAAPTGTDTAGETGTDTAGETGTDTAGETGTDTAAASGGDSGVEAKTQDASLSTASDTGGTGPLTPETATEEGTGAAEVAKPEDL